MRLENKTAIVVGGGQSGGSTAAIGNGRATAMLFAREGAKVLVVDRDIGTAQETADLITEEGNIALRDGGQRYLEEEVAAAIAECKDAWGQVDILHNNVGISVAGGDAPIEDITSEAFDLPINVNLRGTVYATKYSANHAGTERWRHRKHFFDGRVEQLSLGRLQNDEVGGDRFDRTDGPREMRSTISGRM